MDEDLNSVDTIVLVTVDERVDLRMTARLGVLARFPPSFTAKFGSSDFSLSKTRLFSFPNVILRRLDGGSSTRGRGPAFAGDNMPFLVVETGSVWKTAMDFIGDGEERGESGRLRSHGVPSTEEKGERNG